MSAPLRDAAFTCACLIVASRVPSSRESVAASAASTTSTTPAHRIHLCEPANPPVSGLTVVNPVYCRRCDAMPSRRRFGFIHRRKAVLTHARSYTMRSRSMRSRFDAVNGTAVTAAVDRSYPQRSTASLHPEWRQRLAATPWLPWRAATGVMPLRMAGDTWQTTAGYHCALRVQPTAEYQRRAGGRNRKACSEWSRTRQHTVECADRRRAG